MCVCAFLHLFGDVLLVVSALDVRNMDVVGDELAAITHGGDGRRVLVEEVDLLERETLGLGNAEVREDDAARAC